MGKGKLENDKARKGNGGVLLKKEQKRFNVFLKSISNLWCKIQIFHFFTQHKSCLCFYKWKKRKS